MRKLILIVAGLALVATSAEARYRRHYSRSATQTDPERPSSERSYARRVPDRGNFNRTGIAALIPRAWRLEPPDPGRPGSRFVSPAGELWLRLYATPADQETIDKHLRGVAFVDGEDLTFLQREPSWVAVSGFKGERRFYRKATLACGGRQWRYVVMEFPAEAKREFDPIINRMSRALERSIDEDCDYSPEAPEGTAQLPADDHRAGDPPQQNRRSRPSPRPSDRPLGSGRPG